MIIKFRTEKADWYFIISATLVWISALVVTAWDFIQFQKAVYHVDLKNLIGLISILIGAIIRKKAKKTLGKYFSAGLRILEDHKLVTHGIYRYVRHSAYLGVLPVWLGVPLLFFSLYGFLIMLLLVPCYLYKIRLEEEMLIKKFGKKYLEYMKRTKKLILSSTKILNNSLIVYLTKFTFIYP